jgi:hypothetical protein
MEIKPKEKKTIFSSKTQQKIDFDQRKKERT